MASISISAAWDETNALVRREAALLVPVALALIVLPGVLIDQLRPLTGSDAATPAMLVNPIGLLTTLFASLTLTLLALRPGISVAEALKGAFRRFGVAIGASLLLGVGFALLVAPALPLLTGGEAAVQKLNPALALLLLLYMIAVLIGLFYALVRMLLLNTVAATERLGIFATLARSWELTRGLFWRLLGFVGLFLAASIIASAAVVVAGGTLFLGLGRVIGNEPLGRMLLDILTGTVNAAFVTWLYLMLASIYRQLVGSNNGI